MLISGPLVTGKTLMAQKLSEFYNVPYIGIQNVLEEWITEEYDPKGADADNDP